MQLNVKCADQAWTEHVPKLAMLLERTLGTTAPVATMMLAMLNVRGGFDYEPTGGEDIEALQVGMAEHGIRVTILEAN